MSREADYAASLEEAIEDEVKALKALDSAACSKKYFRTCPQCGAVLRVTVVRELHWRCSACGKVIQRQPPTTFLKPNRTMNLPQMPFREVFRNLDRAGINARQAAYLEYCETPRTTDEIAQEFGTSREYAGVMVLEYSSERSPLLEFRMERNEKGRKRRHYFPSRKGRKALAIARGGANA